MRHQHREYTCSKEQNRTNHYFDIENSYPITITKLSANVKGRRRKSYASLNPNKKTVNKILKIIINYNFMKIFYIRPSEIFFSQDLNKR